MPMPISLCQFNLPNGKLCRQVALKDLALCRHHTRTFRDLIQKTVRDEAMSHLEDCLNAMELPELLHTLERKLNRIVRTMPAFDEARTTLRIAIQRLHQLNEDAARFQQSLQTQHLEVHPAPGPGPKEYPLQPRKVVEKRMQPMN